MLTYFLSFTVLSLVDEHELQNTLIQEGKEMASLLYTYRSCVKALPQVNFSLLCPSIYFHVNNRRIIP